MMAIVAYMNSVPTVDVRGKMVMTATQPAQVQP